MHVIQVPNRPQFTKSNSSLLIYIYKKKHIYKLQLTLIKQILQSLRQLKKEKKNLPEQLHKLLE